LKIFTKIVAAEEEELVSVGESVSPEEEWSVIEWPGLDTDKVAMLHCLLTGDELSSAFILYDPVYVADAGPILLRMAGTVQERLAEFAELADDVLKPFAEELAATEAFEVEACDPEDVHSLLLDLAELARLAESQGQVLFIWMLPSPA
jgi:hypothetical protein